MAGQERKERGLFQGQWISGPAQCQGKGNQRTARNSVSLPSGETVSLEKKKDGLASRRWSLRMHCSVLTFLWSIGLRSSFPGIANLFYCPRSAVAFLS